MSQNDQIISHLKRFGSITPMVALRDYGCFRLAARVMELREHYEIDTVMIERDNKRYAKYFYKRGSQPHAD